MIYILKEIGSRLLVAICMGLLALFVIIVILGYSLIFIFIVFPIFYVKNFLICWDIKKSYIETIKNSFFYEFKDIYTEKEKMDDYL